MYEMLKKLAVRPDPHSSMTVREPWTRPHIASQMLAYHLDQDTHPTSGFTEPGCTLKKRFHWIIM